MSTTVSSRKILVPSTKAPVPKMSVEAFLAWSDGTDTRYELIDGVPVAMAEATDAHAILSATLVMALHPVRTRRPGCAARDEAGIRRMDWKKTWFVADVAVGCGKTSPGLRGTPEPVLVVEVISPSTEDHDRGRKLPAYRVIPSIVEIVLVDSQTMNVEVHRRTGPASWTTDILTAPEEVLTFKAGGDIALSLADLYQDVSLAPQLGAEPEGDALELEPAEA